MRTDRVLDLFAGPGGWDEGVRALGLRPFGIEWDTAACNTAMAAGHARLQEDIATLDPREVQARYFDGPIRGLIASPPCQGFSQAGKQQGRKDAHLLLAAIPEMVKRDVRPELREQMKDSRSVLVLEPLRFALALTPSWMAWEQVPAVLPIWEACADVLRSLGYTVATGNLQAEQYGVPQTRKRAILVARAPWMSAAMGPAELPAPTHSRYFSRTPAKLDAGLLPWVSMAEALGWGMTARPYPTVAGGTGGGPDPLAVGGSNARDFIKAAHAAGGEGWVSQQSNYSGPGKPGDSAAERGLGSRELDEPSFALTGRPPRWLRHNQGHRDRPKDEQGVARVRDAEGGDYYQRFATDAPAPSLTTQADAWKWDDAESEDGVRWVVSTGTNTDNRPKSERDYSEGWAQHTTPYERPVDAPAPTVVTRVSQWQVHPEGQRELRMGTGENATVRGEDQPAPTVHFGERLNTVEWVRGETTVRTSMGTPKVDGRNGTHELDPFERPAHTVTGKAGEWQVNLHGSERPNATVRPAGEPAPTIVGGNDNANRKWKGSDGTAVRVTISEAAVLQSFPADYPWQGTKTAQYRQVGDAVPPRLALAVVSKVAGIELELSEDSPWPFRKPAPTVVGSMHGVLTKPGQTHHAAMREVTAQDRAEGEGVA